MADLDGRDREGAEATHGASVGSGAFSLRSRGEFDMFNAGLTSLSQLSLFMQPAGHGAVPELDAARVQRINLHSNCIASLDGLGGLALPALLELCLSSNVIRELDCSALSALAGLTTLDVRANEITTVINAASLPRALSTLRLGMNSELGSLEWLKDAVKACPALRTLDVRDCDLRSPQDLAPLAVATSLRELQLQALDGSCGNPVCDIEGYRPAVLRLCPSVQVLDETLRSEPAPARASAPPQRPLPAMKATARSPKRSTTEPAAGSPKLDAHGNLIKTPRFDRAAKRFYLRMSREQEVPADGASSRAQQDDTKRAVRPVSPPAGRSGNDKDGEHAAGKRAIAPLAPVELVDVLQHELRLELLERRFAVAPFERAKENVPARSRIPVRRGAKSKPAATQPGRTNGDPVGNPWDDRLGNARRPRPSTTERPERHRGRGAPASDHSGSDREDGALADAADALRSGATASSAGSGVESSGDLSCSLSFQRARERRVRHPNRDELRPSRVQVAEGSSTDVEQPTRRRTRARGPDAHTSQRSRSFSPSSEQVSQRRRHRPHGSEKGASKAELREQMRAMRGELARARARVAEAERVAHEAVSRQEKLRDVRRHGLSGSAPGGQPIRTEAAPAPVDAGSVRQDSGAPASPLRHHHHEPQRSKESSSSETEEAPRERLDGWPPPPDPSPVADTRRHAACDAGGAGGAGGPGEASKASDEAQPLRGRRCRREGEVSRSEAATAAQRDVAAREKAMRAEIAALRGQIESAKEGEKASEATVAELQDALAVFKRKAEAVEADLAATKDTSAQELARSADALLAAQKRASLLETELSDTQTQLRECRAESVSLQLRVETHESTTAALRERVSGAETALAAEKAAKAELRRLLDDAESRIAGLESQNRRLAAENERLQKLEADAIAAQQRMEAASRIAHQQLVEASATSALRAKEEASSARKWEDEAAAAQRAAAFAEREVARLERELEESKTRARAAAEQAAAAGASQARALQERLQMQQRAAEDEVRRVTEAANARVRKYHSAAEAAEARAAELAQLLRGAVAKDEEQRHRIEELERSGDSRTKELDAAVRKAREELEEERERSSAAAARAAERMGKLVEERDAAVAKLTAERSAMAEERARWQQQRQALDAEISAAAESLDKAETAIKVKDAEMKAQVDAERSLKKRLATLEAEATAEEQGLREAIADLQAQVEELQTKLDAARLAAKTAESAQARAEADAAADRDAREKAVDEARKLRETAAEVESARAEAASKAAALQFVTKEVSELKDLFSQRENKLREERDRARDDLRDVAAKLRDVEEKLSTQSREADAALARRDADVAAARELAEQRGKRVATVEAEMRVLLGRLDRERESARANLQKFAAVFSEMQRGAES